MIRAALPIAVLGALLFGQELQAQVRIALPDRLRFDLHEFRLESGQTLPDAHIAYATLGTLNESRSNAVLLPSWYGSDYHGYDFLIGPGKALDPTRYFLIFTEMFGSGTSSSPSNTPAPFDGPRFPVTSIRDNVEAVFRLLTGRFKLGKLHAVVGFSMGAQQAFQWAVSHPRFVSMVVAYCGTAKTYPHGVVRLESAISALTADPEFNGGDYATRPVRGLLAWAHHWSAWVYSQEWWRKELYKPTFATVDEALAGEVERQRGRDPNNLILQARTWQQHDVGATPGFGGQLRRALQSIAADVLYMPSETDLYFPVADAKTDVPWIPKVTFRPIPSIWGHRAGSGRNEADVEFRNREIGRFLH
jgi:homoserine O-acetyltransferase